MKNKQFVKNMQYPPSEMRNIVLRIFDSDGYNEPLSPSSRDNGDS